MKKILALLCAALCMLAVWQKQPAAAENEVKNKEQVKICISMPPHLARALADDFTAASGIEAEVVPLPPGSVDNRFKFLANSGSDVWLGGTVEEFYLAAERGLLVSYQPEEAYAVPAEFRQNNWLWTALYIDHIGFLSNKQNLHYFGLYAPESWQDLLADELKFELALPDPKNGGAGYGMMTALWQLKGEKAAMEYAAALNAQRPEYFVNLQETIDEVRMGYKTVAVVPLSLALLLERSEQNLFATLPNDGNKNLISGAAVLNGKNQAAAGKFIDYLLSRRAAEIVGATGHQLIWSISSAADDDLRDKYTGKLLTPVDDLSWTAGQKAEVIVRWQNAGREQK